MQADGGSTPTSPLKYAPQLDLTAPVKVSESMWTLGERQQRRLGGVLCSPAFPSTPKRQARCARLHSLREHSAAPHSKPQHTHARAEDGELHVTLTKLEAGDPWPAVIKGHEVDPLTQQKEQQRLMLERFQREVRRVFDKLQ